MTLLTVGDVARMCKLSPSTIRNLKEQIGYLKVGGSVRFREEDVHRYLDGCEMNTEPKEPSRVQSVELKFLHL